MVRKVLIGALMLVALFAAPAAAQYPDFTVTPGGVEAGGSAGFQGSGCQPGETVVVTVDGRVVATVVADAGGDYSGSFVVDLAPGEYTVTATCGNVVNTSPLLVRGVTQTSTPPTSRPGGTAGAPLARTGSNVNGLALAGAALLLAGGGAMVVARKRFA